MGWLEFKWWIRDNVTDPMCDVIEKSGTQFFDSAKESVDRLQSGGDKVIDAVFDPIGTAGAAVDWVKENPKEVVKAVASSKQDGSHDHRYNKGPDRTPSQKKADGLKEKR